MFGNEVRRTFRWIGDGVTSENRKYVYYESFALNDIIFKLGDFVLVRNDDSIDSEDISNCFIARIKNLYESGSKYKPYNAKVQWFSRIAELPAHCRGTIKKVNDYEVIADMRTYRNVIDAETIFEKCLVFYSPVKIDKEPRSCVDEYPVFFCRYKLIDNKLQPIVKSLCKDDSICSSPIKRNQTTKQIWKSPRKRTNSEPESKIQYRVVETGNTQPRVVLKRIDSRILESQTENVRILVAKPDAKLIEDVSKNLCDLTLMSSPTKTRNQPYIHSFTNNSQVSNKKEIISKTSDSNSGDSDSCPIAETVINKRGKISKKSEGVQTPRRMSSRLQNNTPKKLHTVKKDNSSQSPIKASPVKTPRKLDFSSNAEPCLRRSSRKIKPAIYTCDSSEEESKRKVHFSGKKGKSKFIRTSCSDSGSEIGFSLTSSENSSDSECELESDEGTLASSRKQQKSKSHKKTISKQRTLSIPNRVTPLKKPQNVLEESRLRLHVSAVPESLPCREEEYSDILSFVKGCLHSQTGGCMYISGVPGTGKTATVHEVIRNLQQESEEGEVPPFTFIEVNGMWMTDPYQAYVHIFKCLTGKTIASQQAAQLLEKRFTEPGPKKDAVVLLVDELDRLWTRKQTVMYNIFDWPTKKHSKLIVLAIANTMDLPERLMMNRISSRLGLTRKTFQPYNFKQLQEIIMSRIKELNVFDSDAVQLVSRKVAAVSGDARRALDICRHATEVTEKSRSSPKKKFKALIGMEQVDAAIQQMFSSPIISAIRAASKMEKLFFQCMLAEFKRIGSEETNLKKISENIIASCRFEGVPIPSSEEIAFICSRLAKSHLVLVDDFRWGPYMKIRLNASPDDVNYALTGLSV